MAHIFQFIFIWNQFDDIWWCTPRCTSIHNINNDLYIHTYFSSFTSPITPYHPLHICYCMSFRVWCISWCVVVTSCVLVQVFCVEIHRIVYPSFTAIDYIFHTPNISHSWKVITQRRLSQVHGHFNVDFRLCAFFRPSFCFFYYRKSSRTHPFSMYRVAGKYINDLKCVRKWEILQKYK